MALAGDTIPHSVLGKADGGKVLLRPAGPGTGIIAGGGVRAVLEAAGVKNVLSKSLGSNNKLAVVTATMAGLGELRTEEEILRVRGLAPEEPSVESTEEEQLIDDPEKSTAEEPVAEEPPSEEPVAETAQAEVAEVEGTAESAEQQEVPS